MSRIKLGLERRDERMPWLASDRTRLRAAFAAFGGGTTALSWEVRPFKRCPFLRLQNGDLLLLGRPWLSSWLGEGFHYRALTQAQATESKKTTGRYTRYAGKTTERYALDLVFGEQAYGKGDGGSTSDNHGQP